MTDSPELGTPPPPSSVPSHPGGQRPWDYDTEDSGVDSVSSVVGLEADHRQKQGGPPPSTDYNQVMMVNGQQKSFLHDRFGGTGTHSTDEKRKRVLDCNENNGIYDDVLSSKKGTAKNFFLSSLLEEATVETPKLTAKSPALALLPELVQLLDSEGGTIELVGRDGTRASLKVTLVPPSPKQPRASSPPSAPVRKSSFNRAHRNSGRRSSQRRGKHGETVVSSVAGVRRRPSNGKKIPSNKVATLASKFNTLINESRRPNSPSTSVVDKTISLSPGKRVKPNVQLTKTVGSGTTSGVKRNPSTKPTVDTIPETPLEPAEESASEHYKHPRRKNHEVPKLVHSSVRPLPSDPGRGQSMYGTVKNIVRQAIRKFEKLDGASEAAAEGTEAEQPVRPSTPPSGIEPNSSFLWRDQKTMQNMIYEATGFNGRSAKSETYYDQLSSRRTSNAYDTLLNKSSSSSSSNGYDEIQAPTTTNADNNKVSNYPVNYDDIIKPATYDELSFLHRRQSNGYDELLSPLSVSSSGGYIDPGSSSALGYERILPPKEQSADDEDGSTLRYEECGSAPQPKSLIFTAVPAVVQENQLDSISYLYDDIRNGRGGYGGSQNSYEPIYAHLSEKGTMATNGDEKCSDTGSSEEGAAHEVCSYRLTQLGQAVVPDSPAPSVAGMSTSSTTRTGTERRSVTSDEWVDISDGDPEEQPAWTVTRVRHQRHDPANASFARRGHRSSRRNPSITKPETVKTWSQTMRTLVKNGFTKAATLSRRTGREVLGMTRIKSPINIPAAGASSTGESIEESKKSSARRLPSVETEASGTGSSQTWEDCGESDGDDLAADHHYEALYEVINPGVQHTEATTPDQPEDSFDDSFDSDDAFEEVVVRGLDTTSDTSRDRPGSRSGSERSKDSEDPSLRSGQYGMARFADMAGEKMRKLRRNWSTTKTDITQTITRIKKKSTASVADLSEVFRMSVATGSTAREDSSPEKELSSPPPQLHSPTGREQKKKGTWALRQIRRRMTVSQPSGGLSKSKEPSTFYLTLTIEQGQAGNKESSPSETSSPEPAASTPSPLPPLVTPPATAAPTISKLPVQPRRTSSASSLHYQATVRPKTAPPDPPVRSPSVPDCSPPAAPARNPVSSERKLTISKSSESLDEHQTQYCDIAIQPYPSSFRKGSSLSSEGSGSNTPYSRLSLASNGTYMSVGDMATGSDIQRPEEVRSYMDLQPPLESEELYISSHFADEPLYQFYTAAIIERAANNQGEGSEEDDYEVIGENRKKEESSPEPNGINKLPTAMELVTPLSGRRTLWCELPQVINSGLLEKITPQQRKVQEAMFELITSEASYLRSLNVLTAHFIQSREFSGDGREPILSRLERHALFSDIVPVRECSEALMTDLEKRWQENVLIREICDILLEHASKHFEVYIRYCTNQLYQERMLRELKENKPQFVEVLRRLESSPVCQSLAMHSFLMLPMQRITRLPLLVDAIFHRLESGTPEFERCRMTMATLNKIVQECNEGARKAERIHEMLVVSNQLDFVDVKAISVMSASRWLVKKGELQRLSWRDMDARLTFGRKIHKQTVYVFLFTDLLVMTKKKGEDSFAVLDYCPRNMVQVEEQVRMDKWMGKPGSELGKNLILLTMLQNHENKTVEMILSCSSESDRTRWLEAFTPRTSDNPEEKIYEEWDCPQVQAVHPYVATQPDELSLEVTDVVNVLRKMADGWYQGERLRDDERGWFPGNYTVEIASSHVRARNLRQRYRLLALSGSFIEEQARKDREESNNTNKRKSKKLSVTE